MKTPNSRRHNALRASVFMAGGILLVLLLGAFTTVVSLPLIERSGQGAVDFFLRKGPHRLFGRVTMIWLLILLPFLLKAMGWSGWRDMGWQAARRDAVRDTLAGFVAGAVAMMLIVGSMLVVGTRLFTETEGLVTLSGYLLKFALSCIAVSLLEEAVARGIFYRCLARVWGGVAAALAISFVFALLHFARPLPAAFDGGPALATTWNVLASISDNMARTSALAVRLTNLTLMSLCLCALVSRTGTIWAAVGLHAGLVWIKHLNGHLTETAAASTPWAWLGHKADATDSPAGTVILFLLLIWILVTSTLRNRSVTPAAIR